MLSTWRWRAPHQHAARAVPFDPPSSCAVATAIVPTLHRRKPRCREGRLARGRTATGRACSCPRTSGVRFFLPLSSPRGAWPAHSHAGTAVWKAVLGHRRRRLAWHRQTVTRYRSPESRCPFAPCPSVSSGHAGGHSGEFRGLPRVSTVVAGRAGLTPRRVILS